MKMIANNEEVEPLLQKRVLKYANRLNLEHFTQFRIPITEMSPVDYENLKKNTKLPTGPPLQASRASDTDDDSGVGR